MKIVVNTNILFSFFWQKSLTRKLLITSSLDLISPEFALFEIEKYSQDIIEKIKITKKEFDVRFKELKEIVEFVDKKEYYQFLKDAEIISSDKDDSDFFALCLKNSCFLWSNDLILKNQKKVEVLSTKDIIEIIF
ncbi:hypothetical protein J4436_00480 [Candidatus Woesearchaeota archaeon]|nr:hypothetical protein [Candidatus Woesearchaeota archaeon]